MLYSLETLIFEKAHTHYKLIFKASQSQEIPEYDMFHQALFCALASTMNLGLNTVLVTENSVCEEISLLSTKD